MHLFIVQAACLPLFALLFAGLFTNRLMNSQVLIIRRWLTILAGLNSLAGATLLAMTQISGPVHWTLGPKLPVALSFYIDGVSALMLALVTSVGWVICRFSIRYLDGEDEQGRYFRWTAVTIGAVSMAVVTANLIILTASLLLTSVGLHQLLVHYSDRPAGRRSAAVKFFFSRLGDICLLVAAFALYFEFGTFNLTELFSRISSLSATDIAAKVSLPVAAWSLVACAMFKSAQFPFHTWLPETMEAPTPVSALMHAGIVNAGGYLLIRTAPIVLLTPAALWAVAGLGAFTALLAALVMMSQTSVKRKLAWSTIAQMGFMMLQCGLGAFSAAMLHIVAHSLYKAHAFLSSGSVMTERIAIATAPAPKRSRLAHIAAFVLALGITLSLFDGVASLFGVAPEAKPGGLVLGLVLCLGIARWMQQMFTAGWAFVFPGVAISAGLMVAYFTTFVTVDFVVTPSLLAAPPLFTTASFIITATIAFTMLLVIQSLVSEAKHSQWMKSLYVHSSNGFYVDVFWRNAAKSLSM
jgi:NAD(P)H-quinone oxidoreductase subunit 5